MSQVDQCQSPLFSLSARVHAGCVADLIGHSTSQNGKTMLPLRRGRRGHDGNVATHGVFLKFQKGHLSEQLKGSLPLSRFETRIHSSIETDFCDIRLEQLQSQLPIVAGGTSRKGCGTVETVHFELASLHPIQNFNRHLCFLLLGKLGQNACWQSRSEATVLQTLPQQSQGLREFVTKHSRSSAGSGPSGLIWSRCHTH